MPIDLTQIKKLIEMVKDTDVTEIEVGEGESLIRIQRGNYAPIVHTAAPVHAVAPKVEKTAETKATSDQHAVRSPMVGTFYVAASPTAKPFVEVGQSVKVGDVLCIVEAMKMLNQIESDRSGTVKARLVENGMPVEFDQPLFVIE